MSVLSSTLAEAARRFGDRPALVHDDRVLSFAQLDQLAGRLAAVLSRRGLSRGDLVALVLPASIEYVVAYAALARVGAVTTGVPPRFTPDERRRVLERANPQLVIATAELDDGIPSGVEVVRCELAADVESLWQHLLRDAAGAVATEPGSADPDVAETVVFTSGTTGVPKGALFTSRQIAAITWLDTGGEWGRGGPHLVATALPHVGFMTKFAGYLQQGCSLHLLSRWRAADALRIIARERIAYVGGVAAQISLLLAVPDFDSYDVSAVRGLIVGAGPSPPALVQEARRRFGAGYSIRYSSTESGGLGTLTAFDAPDEEALFTVGRPRPGTDLEIRSPDDGRVMGVGDVGQICLRSPAVMAGYWRDADATADALDGDGWLRTGDLGYVGPDGCLRITGRIADMYIRGGYNVYPLEVEAVLGQHPAVAGVVVVPQSDSVMGEIGVAVVVPRTGVDPPSLAELRELGGRRLATYKLPESLRIVDALPLTSMDKVDRRALAANLRAEQPPPTSLP